MSAEVSIKAPAVTRPLSEAVFWSIGATLTLLAYWLVLILTGNGSLSAGVAAVRNLVPLVILTAILQPLLPAKVFGLPLPRQILAHILLAALFSLLWYWLLMILIGVSQGTLTEFTVAQFFPTPAISWQLMQGATFYAMIAALIALREAVVPPSFVIAGEALADTGKDIAPSRYFIRRGDEMYPLDLASIVCITGADNYAEVSTGRDTLLTRMTLTDFEKALEGSNFLRIHRSHLVNVNRIDRAEPAGNGRLLVHMDTGQMIQTSRTGARLLRDRLI